MARNHLPPYSYIIISKSEWARLQKQRMSPAEEPNIDKEHLKTLTKLSQEWIKSWPDAVAGHSVLLEKKKQQEKKQRQADNEFVKVMIGKQAITAEAIKRARSMIFQDSNYGRQLLSALLESKATDMRDAQIKFHREQREKAAALAKEEEPFKKGGILDLCDSDAERVEKEKLKILECNKFNKEIIALKKAKELQEKLEKKQCAIEEEQIIKQVLEMEKKAKENNKRREMEKLKEFATDSKNNTIMKQHDEKLDVALTDIYKREQDRIRLKTQEVLQKGRPYTKFSKTLFENLKRIQSEDNKRYEDFIDKGVKAFEKRISETEANNKLKNTQKSLLKHLNVQTQQITAKSANEENLAKGYANKDACEPCDEQSFSMKNKGKPKNETETKINDESATKSVITDKRKKESVKFPFFALRNKLTEEVKKREKEPSPWNGTRAAHGQFAQKAEDVLKEIKHKCFAMKVVNDYRRNNCLYATTLPVSNF